MALVTHKTPLRHLHSRGAQCFSCSLQNRKHSKQRLNRVALSFHHDPASSYLKHYRFDHTPGLPTAMIHYEANNTKTTAKMYQGGLHSFSYCFYLDNDCLSQECSSSMYFIQPAFVRAKFKELVTLKKYTLKVQFYAMFTFLKF